MKTSTVLDISLQGTHDCDMKANGDNLLSHAGTTFVFSANKIHAICEQHMHEVGTLTASSLKTIHLINVHAVEDGSHVLVAFGQTNSDTYAFAAFRLSEHHEFNETEEMSVTLSGEALASSMTKMKHTSDGLFLLGDSAVAAFSTKYDAKALTLTRLADLEDVSEFEVVEHEGYNLLVMTKEGLK